MKKVCLIGGGTSNIICAIELSKDSNFEIDIYEASNKLGRKILASGNGRCNILNSNLSCDDFYNLQFVKNILYSYDYLKMYLNNQGILLSDPDECGRVYPISYYSRCVLNPLLNLLNKENIHIYLNTQIDKIMPLDNKYSVNNKEYDYVIVSIGSNADQKFKINPLEKSLKALGFKMSKNYPSICPLRVKENITSLDGIRAKSDVYLKINGKTLVTSGEVLFKKNEISGICVFEQSVNLNWERRNNGCEKATLSIDLLPGNNDLNCLLKKQNKLCLELLDGIFRKELAYHLYKRLNFDIFSKLNDEQIDRLVKLIHNLSFELDLDNYSDIYQVVCGGLKVDQLTNTLESKSYKNMFFGGEFIDVDGKCGGYNLSFAICCGLRIAGEIKNVSL